MAVGHLKRFTQPSGPLARDTGFALVLLALATGLVAAGLYALAATWGVTVSGSVRYDSRTFATDPTVGEFGTLPYPDAASTVGTLSGWPGALRASVPSPFPDVPQPSQALLFVVDRLLPAGGAAEGRFILLPTEACAAPAFVSASPGDDQLNERADRVLVQVDWDREHGGDLLFQCTGGRPRVHASSPTVRMPLDGVPQAYPSDEYDAHLFAFFMVPDPGGDEPRAIPFQFWVTAGPEMAGTDIAVAQTPTAGSPYFEGFLLQIARDRPTRIFAYAMALIPLAVAVLLFHVLFLARPAQGEPVHHLLLNVAAAMIAVLPLRQVLVPQEITGLTRVDLLLGVGLVVIIALALVRYALVIKGHARPAPPPE